MSVVERVRFSDLLEGSNLEPAYQPIVDLDSGLIVAYEALARWPGLGISPGAAFEAAARNGALAVLDEACQAAAVRGAGALRDGQALFVNCEPGAFSRRVADGMVDGVAGNPDMQVVIEITERALAGSPAGLLRACRQIRERGWRLALDDVGALPESLALMPFVAPDVIKLDLSLVQSWPDYEQARIMAAVMAHSERSGATVLAEGIETAEHLEQAVALGATLGQGWYFARPGPIDTGGPAGDFHTPPTAMGAPPVSPFSLVEGSSAVRIGRKGLLLAITRHLENQAATIALPPVVLSAFQDRHRFPAATRRRYAGIAERSPLVGVFGRGMPAEPAGRVRGAALAAEDPLAGEWTVVVVGAHYAGGLIARDLGDTGTADLDRRFAFTVTHDRDLVIEAATAMLDRLPAL